MSEQHDSGVNHEELTPLQKKLVDQLPKVAIPGSSVRVRSGRDFDE